MISLTIAIPTYNRAHKLARVLKNILDQISDFSELYRRVEIAVSDNGSTDRTQEVLNHFDPKNVKFRHFRQNSNLGLDKNMRFLYTNCATDYVWFFSDDDILFPGAIKRVLDALDSEAPDALLFSFRQPPGSNTRTFDFKKSLTVIKDPKHIIPLLSRAPKLSIYVLKCIELKAADLDVLSQFLGTNYDFIALAYTIFQNSKTPKLCVISEALAGCDPDFNMVRFSPETWGCTWVVYKHPYAKNHAPWLEFREKRRAYYLQLQALFAYKTGTLLVENPDQYESLISKLEICTIWLLRRPKSALQMSLLKTNLARFWPFFRKYVRSNKV